MHRALPLALSFLPFFATAAPPSWQPFDPGAASAQGGENRLFLANKAIAVEWPLGARSAKVLLKNGWTGEKLTTSEEPFMLALRSGGIIRASQLQHSVPTVSSRNDAKTVTVNYTGSGLVAQWKATIRNHSNYVRFEVSIRPTVADIDASKVVLLNLEGTKPQVAGTVPGSPIVDGGYFFGLEHPISTSTVTGKHLSCFMERKLPLRKGQTTTYSCVIGVTPKGQTRRAFNAYVEAERARPYSPFLHYNSWYDIGYFTPFTAKECVERIHTYGVELNQKRGVKLSSFLFDDGWDDTSTVWEFHKGFPLKFTPLKDAAKVYGAGPGVWLSPWGGYGGPREKRLATGKAAGMEIDSSGYALSGPKYYKRFREVCLDFVTKYGVNQFKFDGTGSPDKQFPGSAFGSDFEAAIQLIQDLRKAQPKLFVNLTTGTWPSPFWTRHADSIWRGGSDHGFSGVGSDRQRWITYRDGDLYNGVVKRGPLFPINSLMLHGLIYAQHAHHLNNDPNDDFRSEILSYFGEGTQLQEMYITPKLLSKQNWDDLAAAAKWSQANADVLKDSHWVGGDPAKLEVYGFASWNDRKGILVLRNPNEIKQAFSVDLVRVFELPASVKGTFKVQPVFNPGQPENLTVGSSRVFDLKPFEVKVLEVTR